MHLACIWIVSHISAKNYRNWWKFDEVLTKTNLFSFFVTRCIYTVSQNKKVPTFKLYVTSSDLHVFSKFLHCWKVYEICYKTHERFEGGMHHLCVDWHIFMDPSVYMCDLLLVFITLLWRQVNLLSLID